MIKSKQKLLQKNLQVHLDLCKLEHEAMLTTRISRMALSNHYRMHMVHYEHRNQPDINELVERT
jgi:hypothetical protein